MKMSEKTLSEKEKAQIMREIESKTEKEVISGIRQGKIQILKGEGGDIVSKIMEKSAMEFKEKVGREMTYSEMRAMFG